MATIIIIIILILFLVLIGWTWNSLGNIEKNKKMLYIIVGLIISWIITFIIYKLSQIGINYESQEVMKSMQSIYVTLFTIVNGYIILPFTFRTIEQINENEIDKQRFQKRAIIFLIILILIGIFECKYLANIQIDTIELIKNLKNK